MWTVTLDQSATELLSLLIFFSFFSFGEEKKKDFLLLLVGDYMRVRERAKRRVLAGIVDSERKKTFAGLRLGEIKKKSTAASVSHAEIREREGGNELNSWWCRTGNFFFSHIKKWGWWVNERLLLTLLLESWWNELALGRKRVEKKSASMLPSAEAKRVTSNQNSDEDWLVDDDVTCDMSRKKI